MRANDMVNAEKYYLKALDISVKCNEGLGMSSHSSDSLHNLATVYLSQKRFDDALRMFNKSIEIIRAGELDTSCSLSIADTLNNMGTLYMEMGNIKEVLKKLKIYI